MVGDIYLAKIYFTDLSAYKLRPVSVIKELDDDCMCMQLTTQTKAGRLTIGQQDLVKGGLKKSLLSLCPKTLPYIKVFLSNT